MKTLALVLLLCCPAITETAYKSLDGNLYPIRDSAAGPRFEKLTDGGPTNPVPPTDDKFGLVKDSREEASWGFISEVVGLVLFIVYMLAFAVLFTWHEWFVRTRK